MSFNRPHMVSFGKGTRKALLLHCSLAHSGAWRGVASELNDDLTMRAIDLPGHGRSPDWDHKTPLQALSLQWALSNLDRPVDVIGHSFGGTVALRMAIEYPDLVRSLVLIEPVCFAIGIAESPDTGVEDFAPYVDWVPYLDHGNAEEAARLFNRTWGDGTRWADLPKALRQSMTQRIHLVRAADPELIDDTVGILKPGVLDRVRCPTLLLQGNQSPPIMASILTGLSRRLPNTAQHIIAGAGHMVPITHPAQVANAIRPFLAAHPP